MYGGSTNNMTPMYTPEPFINSNRPMIPGADEKHRMALLGSIPYDMRGSNGMDPRLQSSFPRASPSQGDHFFSGAGPNGISMAHGTSMGMYSHTAPSSFHSEGAIKYSRRKDALPCDPRLLPLPNGQQDGYGTLSNSMDLRKSGSKAVPVREGHAHSGQKQPRDKKKSQGDDQMNEEALRAYYAQLVQYTQKYDTPSLKHEALFKVFDEILNELCLEVCYEVHRNKKLGINGSEPLAKKGHDILTGQKLAVNNGEEPRNYIEKVLCPNCGQFCGPSFFARHLDNCMLSNRRRAAHTGKQRTLVVESFDDNEDEDGTYSDKATNKKATKPARVRKTKDFSSREKSIIERLKESEPLQFLVKQLQLKCGVISQKTGRMCTKTLRCPQHRPKQRDRIRKLLLGENWENMLNAQVASAGKGVTGVNVTPGVKLKLKKR